MREPGFFVPPMLAVTAQEPFDDSQWIYEVKWDGYRCQIHWNGTLRLYSRQGHDLLTQFPDLQDAGTFLPFPMVLDADHPGQRVRFWQKFLAEYRQWALVPYVSRRKHHGGWLWAIVSAETQLPLGLLPAPRSWSVPEELQQTSADMVPLKPPLHAEVSYRMLTDTGRMRHGRIRRWRR
ncbi:hypothetical protein [Sulfobacillus thermotolerans]|uniref:ATP-dependent DNA ligase n=1 Tax=Sulfobacillus thermotolerans TaxID=338644 RepID=UPI003365B5BF